MTICHEIILEMNWDPTYFKIQSIFHPISCVWWWNLINSDENLLKSGILKLPIPDITVFLSTFRFFNLPWPTRSAPSVAAAVPAPHATPPSSGTSRCDHSGEPGPRSAHGLELWLTPGSIDEFTESTRISRISMDVYGFVLCRFLQLMVFHDFPRVMSGPTHDYRIHARSGLRVVSRVKCFCHILDSLLTKEYNTGVLRWGWREDSDQDDKSYDVDDGETGKDDKKNEDEHDDLDGEQRFFFYQGAGECKWLRQERCTFSTGGAKFSVCLTSCSKLLLVGVVAR